MSYDSKSKQVDKTEGKVSFLERLIHGKGTVAEPWPTAEELWNNPEVKKIIDAHNQSVR